MLSAAATIVSMSSSTSHPRASDRTIAECRYKLCRKTAKDGDNEHDIQECVNSQCSFRVHNACRPHGLTAIGADEAFDQVVCSKRCYNAARKSARLASVASEGGKRRVSWHNDGPTPSLSSLSCLMDWITTGSNYSRYRGGDAQHGETKAAIADEILRATADCGITTPRTIKDIQSRITTLKHSYKTASDWLKHTGQGITDESSLRSGILKRCLHYYELQEIMEDRPSTRPLLLNTDFSDSEDEVETEEQECTGGSDSGSTESSGDSAKSHRKRAASVPISVAIATTKKTKTQHDKMTLCPTIAELKGVQLAQEKEFQVMKLKYREMQVNLQREEIDIQKSRADDEAREAHARIREAAARTEKLREEAESCVLLRKITLLRERKQLQNEGVAQEDIDKLLPLVLDF